jgi:thiamine-phosphate pyrophosphorylase
LADADEGCQLYAVVEAGEGALARLEAALAAADIACALIVAPAGRALDAAGARPLIEVARQGGATVLLAGDASLARSLGADGVHIGGAANLADAYQEARRILGSEVVGIDPGISRHDAMSLAEAGADYVAFGAPAHLKDRDKARTRRNELVAWWAEIFQVPCVALDAGTAEEARALAEAGADFVALTLGSGLPPAAARDLAQTFAAAAREPAAA